jgi:tetratricopeptide (TPR) repeat protein
MGPGIFRDNSILAALLLAVGFSVPPAWVLAQTDDTPEVEAPEPEANPDLEPVPEAESPDAAAARRTERQADLLRQLAEAENPYAASLIETELAALWSQSGSAAVDLLLRRGQDALEAGDPEAAIEHFTAAIDHAPDFAEAHAGRAAAYYLTNRVGPAIDDLRQTLVLEPDHIIALQGFGVILEELGRPEDALEIFRRVADMDPQDVEAAEAVARLAASLEGRAL